VQTSGLPSSSTRLTVPISRRGNALSGEDAADLVDLFAGAERDAEKLRYLQGRERALERADARMQP